MHLPTIHVLVVQRSAASTAVILRGKPLLRVAGYERRLRRREQRRAFLQSQLQLLEIVVNSVKDRQANGFAWQVRIGAFHSRFDDQFHDSASSAGKHYCLGVSAALILVGEIALPQLFKRLKGLTLSTKIPTQWTGWVFRGPINLPVEWHPQ